MKWEVAAYWPSLEEVEKAKEEAGLLQRWVPRILARGRRLPGESPEESFFRRYGIPPEMVVAMEQDVETMTDVIYYRYPPLDPVVAEEATGRG